MAMKENLLTVENVKDILHYKDSRTIIKMFKHSAMHAFQIGKKWYVKETDFINFIDLLRKYHSLDSVPGSRSWVGFDTISISGESLKFTIECNMIDLTDNEIEEILEAVNG